MPCALLGEAPTRGARALALGLGLQRGRILRGVVEAAQHAVGGAPLDGRAADLPDQAAHVLGGKVLAKCEPDSRLIDSSIKVPPRSFAPDMSPICASFGPILTHETWMFVIQ